jgi:hypothetical protein
MIVSIVCFMFGVALGQRFKVAILVPAIAIVVVFSVVSGTANPQAIWWILETACAGSLCLQCGYFAGILIRNFLLGGSSQGPSTVASSPTSTSHASR